MPLREYSPLDEAEAADRARLVPLLDQTSGNDDGENDKSEPVVGDQDEEDFLSVRELRNQYLDYLYSKTEEIEEQKDSRRYYHGAQLTAEQLRVLKARHQPVQIWNRIGRKINQIVGVMMKMRTDPKAEGRDPKSEQGAEIANQSIRSVLDGSMFKVSVDHMCLLQAGMEAIGGVQLIMAQGDKGDPDVEMASVVGDEYFYDPRSYNYWFKDCRFEGIAKWMDLDAAIDMFPHRRRLLEGLFEGDSDLTTNPDREIKWLISSARRLRMVEHWYRWRGKWRWAFYVSHVLLDQGVSPFFDEKGRSASSFEMFSGAIDQDGDRYSFVRTFKGPQDALNQGKSKTLALANSRRIRAEKGAVDDVERARIEASRHDGYLEINTNKKFEVDDTSKDVAIFTGFTEDAKNEVDGFANVNMAAITGAGLNNLSGKALELLRQPGMAELGPFMLAHRAWKLNLYRKIWNTIQRHWTQERWIRVNNNQKLAQFIQLNGLDLDQWGRPMIVNAVGQIDVNIVFDEGRDIVSMMNELADKLAKYPPGTFPPQVLIEMDPDLPRSEKDRLLQMMSPKPEQQQLQAATTRLNLEGLAARNAKTAAETQRTLAQVDKESATAGEKRAKTTTEAARAGGIAHRAHMDAAEFVRDSILEAHRVMQPFLNPPNSAAQRQAAPIGASV